MSILKNRVFIGIVSMIFAAVVAFIAVPVVNNITNSTTVVVRAAKDITMGTRITADLIEEVEMGKKNLPSNTVLKKEDVIGKYFTTDLKKGDLVLTSKIATTLILPEAKIRSMGSDEIAVSVEIKGATNMRLLPNDIVMIYEQTQNGAVLVPELKYVSVVTTTTSDGINILQENQTGPDGKQLSPHTITFIVNEQQNQKLLSLEGKMRIVLKYRGNNYSRMKALLDEQAAYFGKTPNNNPAQDVFGIE